jgi:hypothetical protein
VLALVTLVFGLLLPPPQRGCVPAFAPLTTGTSSSDSELPHWPRDEAGGWGGPGWAGWSSTTTRLQRVELIVRPLPRLPGDNRFEEDRVTVGGRLGNVDYAVRCLPQVRAGRPMRSAGVVNEHLIRGAALPVALGRRHYTIRLDGSDPRLLDARVVLAEGARSQVLYAVDRFVDEPHFLIEWAGDIDGDGRLDLVTNLNAKYSLHPVTLWLSSTARRGQLVGRVAVFLTGD